MRRRARQARRAAHTATIALVAFVVACTSAPERAAQDQPEADNTGQRQPTESAPQHEEPTDSFTVAATGDVLIHPELTEQAARDAEATDEGDHDFRPLLSGVEPVISDADLAICHLEVPLAEPGGPYSGFPTFNAPPELADALADTGYDTCSTASNHTLDQGEDGVVRTLETLDEAGLSHAGSARDEQESTSPTIIEVGGVRVGQVAFSFSFNGIPLPEDKPWMANELDADAIIAEAETARDQGAEVVVASLHWGPEYQHEPSEQQRDLAERVLAEDAVDLILGHHAHVVQSIDRIDEKWVAYGLGNHVARHAEPRGTSEEGIAALFEFTRAEDGWRVTTAEYVPTLVDLGAPIRLIDLTDAEPNARYEQAIDRTDEVVLGDDGDEHGLRRATAD